MGQDRGEEAPGGFPGGFKSLRDTQSNNYKDDVSYHFLKTHPLPDTVLNFSYPLDDLIFITVL